jgi:hypothetical protein
MDASKAFDIVNHPSMLNAIHSQGIKGTLWAIVDSMYTDNGAAVKWKGEVSQPFAEYQGSVKVVSRQQTF